MSHSEKIPVQTHERSSDHYEHKNSVEQVRKHVESLEKSAEQARQEHHEKLEQARHKLEKTAVEHHPTNEHAQPAYSHPTKKQKLQTYRHTLRNIQEDLPTRSSQIFSKIIHQPTIENVSEVASKTVFRPSLTLGAALGALVGGSLVYLVAKRYGFELSGTEFILFGIVGAVVGLGCEGLKYLFLHYVKKTI